MERLFIAINLPPEIKKSLFNNYSTLLKPLSNSLCDIKMVKEENLHITIHFLGNTEEKAKLKLNEELSIVSREFSPFTLSIAGFGGFPDLKRPRVLWFGINSCERLKELHEKIGIILQRLNFNIENRDFHPHLTIARINNIIKKNKLSSNQNSYSRRDEFNGIIANISSKLNDIKIHLEVVGFSLFKSILKNEGPIYQELYFYSFKN